MSKIKKELYDKVEKLSEQGYKIGAKLLEKELGISNRLAHTYSTIYNNRGALHSMFVGGLTESKEDKRRVLVIGDLHEPFCLDGYLEHCKEIYKKYNCNEVVFIGDVIDSHYSSYHETDPDGMSGGDELKIAKVKLQKWYQAFPDAYVTVGNHDRIISRKAFSAGVPKEWIKSFNEALDVPKWKFVDRVVIDNVQYLHGEGGTAHTKCRADMMNTVQGHLHTQCYIQHFVGANFKVFGVQVGCGIDFEKYAFAYAKRGKKPAISCTVVLDGETPINELMNL